MAAVVILGLLAAAPVPASAAGGPGVITTVAGGNAPGPSPATSTGLWPTAVAVRGSLVYVSDFARRVVRVVDTTTGTQTVVAGGGTPADGLGDNGPATSAKLDSPRGLALDASGNLFIADRNNHRIRFVNRGAEAVTVHGVSVAPGHIATVAGTGTAGYSGDCTPTLYSCPATSAQLYWPAGVALDASGNLFIADTYNHRIRRVDAAGAITTVAGTGTAGYSGDCISTLTPCPATSAQLNNPAGVTLDASGNLFIADTYNDRIRKLVPGADGVVDGDGDESITTVAGGGRVTSEGAPATLSVLLGPDSVALDAEGNLFVTTGNRVKRVAAADGTMKTVAGTASPGYSGDDQPATSAPLRSPQGAVVDAAGTLYIADTYNYRVRKVVPGADGAVDGDADDIITTVAGTGDFDYGGDGGPASSSQLKWPGDVALDPSGNLYIADSFNKRVRFANRGTSPVTVHGVSVGAGHMATVAGGGSADFFSDGGSATGANIHAPQAVALDPAGNLYIATDKQKVRKVDLAGTITTVAGTGSAGYNGDDRAAGAAQLAAPQGVAVDASGNLYIADTENHRVRKVAAGSDGVVDGSETITTVAGTGNAGYNGDGQPASAAQLARPRRVAVDGFGNLFIADSGNIRIRVVNQGGDAVTRHGVSVAPGHIATAAGTGTEGFAGDGGPANQAELNYPGGVALDASGNLFIADSGNRVRRVDGAGAITTVAGTGTKGFAGDGGPATQAELNYPGGVAVDASGNLFIADTYNNRIRMVKPPARRAPTVADFDGNSSTDIGVFRPSNGVWYVKGAPAVAYGTQGDIPVPGDYDGDGKADMAVFRPSNGVWYVKGITTAAYGTKGDIPVPGDYDGDGKADMAVFRPSNGVWYVKGAPAVAYGTNGDIPVPGDYDGDAKADMAVFRPSNGVWYVKGAPAVAYGTNGDVPVVGDYDGDAKADMAVFRPSSGVWYVKGAPAVAYGTKGDIPVPGDYNGDAKADMAVFRPSSGVWYVKGITTAAYGTNGDVPLPMPAAIRVGFFA